MPSVPFERQDSADTLFSQSYSNDKESERCKFILITYIGHGVRVMRKAKLSVHAADVKAVLRAFSIEVAASGLEDLEEVRFILVHGMQCAVGMAADAS